MITTLRTFLGQIANGLELEGLTPYGDSQIHFEELPRDFLKNNRYALHCKTVKDRKSKDGRLISRERSENNTEYIFTRRRYQHEVHVRCFIHADTFDDLMRSGGLIDQFEQAVVDTKVLADGNNRAIEVELQDVTRPSKTQLEYDRRRDRPYVAIVRVAFIGGLYVQNRVPIIPDIEFEPTIK